MTAHPRWEAILQTTVFVGALLVLVAVLYTSVVVQRGRQETAQRQETALVGATVARKAAPTPTVAAYPRPGSAPTISTYPQPASPTAPADRSAPRAPAPSHDYPLPSPTDATP
jgi:hypothetical protein